MKRLLVALALAGSLGLAGCAGTSFGTFVKVATTTVTNPVGTVDIYRVKNVYAATLQIAVKYRDYCWGRSYAALMADKVAKPVCQNRRQVVRKLQAADQKAYAAIVTADRFARNNPTLNASSAVSAAWKAVTDFQSLTVRTASLSR